MLSEMYTKFPGQQVPASVTAFFAAQEEWVVSNILANPTDPYWVNVGLLMAQFHGMQDGYNSAAPSGAQLTSLQFQMLVTQGDLMDLIPALVPSQRPNFAAMSRTQLMDHVYKTTSCSALIKVDGNYSDIYFGHSTYVPPCHCR